MKTKKLLLVIDFQNDFVTGSLGFPKAKDLEKPIVAKIKEYQKNGDTVAFTLDTHDNNYLQTVEGSALAIVHCTENTTGWRLFGEVENLVNDMTPCFNKHTYGSDLLLDYLRGTNFSEVEIVGVVTDMCVFANAVIVKTALPNAKIIVDAACVATTNEQMGEKALDLLEGIQITTQNRRTSHE